MALFLCWVEAGGSSLAPMGPLVEDTGGASRPFCGSQHSEFGSVRGPSDAKDGTQ
eukprot:CAMPEP_0172638704 /NCGR_PEP_ID=MMETSP1068-20121228/215096_1 /TAXON_ID=35684 /ORGANISM="Pseudopedinella elastica, Strain CCMP716" /LENGTH=54 /DNA_ID=CAMNT_0013451657 /DNA_START=219 /DNA_END=383 /DNA_ORIENTATION=+